jgi:hypothetical protein
MTSRIVIACDSPHHAGLAGYGFNHKVERPAQSVNLQEVFR